MNGMGGTGTLARAATGTLIDIDLRAGAAPYLESKPDCVRITVIRAAAAVDPLPRQTAVVDHCAPWPGAALHLVQCARFASRRACAAKGAAVPVEVDFRKTTVTSDQDVFRTGPQTVVAARADIDEIGHRPRRSRYIPRRPPPATKKVAPIGSSYRHPPPAHKQIHALPATPVRVHFEIIVKGFYPCCGSPP